MSSPAAAVHIHPLAEYRESPRAQLTVVTNQAARPGTPPPRGAEIRRLLAGVLEVLDGRRPIGQLADVLPRRHQKALLTEANATGPGPRTLRSLHLSRTATDVVDLCARIDHGPRSRAITGRLELRQGHWQFTLLAMV
ncbi:MAG TPA: Rv3235 family protein [Pseudonocardiaceae bacterium]|nr:Rv3235 family protein [Pseudonocardiaceae bacterium]